MERKALLDEVKSYFNDSDHWRRLCAALNDPDPTGPISTHTWKPPFIPILWKPS